jgi:hypothetical protein
MSSPKFDLLRVRLEAEVQRPAVIAITSSTAQDGKDIAARELAHSLAATGYATLLVDTSLTSLNPSKLSPGLSLDEIGRLQSTADPKTGVVNVLTLSDATLQRTTNTFVLESALQILRGKFDYVVISTGHGASASFSTSIVAAADAVLVSVRTGRREDAGDFGLAADLERIGSRFVGVVALDPSVIDEDLITSLRAGIPDGQRSSKAQVKSERHPREFVTPT